MTDNVLEARVRRLENTLALSIEQDHECLTRLEDVQASFIISIQNGLAKWQPESAASEQCMQDGFAKLRPEVADSEKRVRQEVAGCESGQVGPGARFFSGISAAHYLGRRILFEGRGQFSGICQSSKVVGLGMIGTNDHLLRDTGR